MSDTASEPDALAKKSAPDTPAVDAEKADNPPKSEQISAEVPDGSGSDAKETKSEAAEGGDEGKTKGDVGGPSEPASLEGTDDAQTTTETGVVAPSGTPGSENETAPSPNKDDESKNANNEKVEDSNASSSQISNDPPIPQISADTIDARRKEVEEKAIRLLVEKQKNLDGKLKRCSPAHANADGLPPAYPHMSAPCPRPKCHFDAVLEEMSWMATDFLEEQKWKVALAKKISREAAHFYSKMQMRLKAKASLFDQHCRVCATSVSKSVASFWHSNSSIRGSILGTSYNSTASTKRSKNAYGRLLKLSRRYRKHNLDSKPYSSAKKKKWRDAVAYLNEEKTQSLEEYKSSGYGVGEDSLSEDETRQDDFPAIPVEVSLSQYNRTNMHVYLEDVCKKFDESGSDSDWDPDDAQDLLGSDGSEDSDSWEANLSASEDESSSSDDEGGLSSTSAKESRGHFGGTKSRGVSKRRKRRYEELADLYRDNQRPLSEALEPYAEAGECSISDLLVDEVDSDNHTGAELYRELVWDPKSAHSDASKQEAALIMTGIVEAIKKFPASQPVARSARRVWKFQQPATMTMSDGKAPMPFHFQESIIKWMENMYLRGFNACVNIGRGLGRVDTIAAFLSNLAIGPCRNWGPHLILVPSYVLVVWEETLRRVSSPLQLFFPGTAGGLSSFSSHFNVCVCSYSVANQHQSQLRRVRWQTLIMDDAHKVKDWNHKQFTFVGSISSKWKLLLGLWDRSKSQLGLANILLPFPCCNAIGAGAGQKVGRGSSKNSVSCDDFINSSTFSVPIEKIASYFNFELKGCKMGVFQHSKYNATKKQCLERIGECQGKKSKLQMLLRSFCVLHYAANHASLQQPDDDSTVKTKRSHVLVMPNLCIKVPTLVRGAVNEIHDVVSFLNLDIVQTELHNGDFSKCEPIRYESILHEGIQNFVFRNEAVEASLLQQDDGGHLVVDVQLQHSSLLKWRERVYEHVAYINRFRCQRQPVYGEALRACVSLPNQRESLCGRLQTEALHVARSVYVNTSRIFVPVPNIESLCVKGEHLSGFQRLKDSIKGGNPDIIFPSTDTRLSSVYWGNIIHASAKMRELLKLLRSPPLPQLKSSATSKTPQGTARSIVIVGIPQMLGVVRGFLSRSGVRYLQLDEDETGSPEHSLSRWAEKCVLFNSEQKFSVALFCGANAATIARLANLSMVDQVVFTDSIEVDSDLPVGCIQFLEQLAVSARPKQLRVVRLFTEGTVEESLLKNSQNKRSISALAKEGFVLKQSDASLIAMHLHDEEKGRGEKFDDDFEDQIAEEQNAIIHIDGEISNVTDRLDEMTVYINEPIKVTQESPDGRGSPQLELDAIFRNYSPGAVLEVDSIQSDFGRSKPPSNEEQKDRAGEEIFFYPLEGGQFGSSPDSSFSQFVSSSSRVQHDDPKCIAFRSALGRKISSGKAVDFHLYGPPDGNSWSQRKTDEIKPKQTDTEALKSKMFTNRHFHPTAKRQLESDGLRADFFLRSHKIAWSPWEDVMLRQGVSSFGANWELISELINDHPNSFGRKRSARQCHARVQKLGAQIFRKRDHEKQKEIVSKYDWATKPATRDDLLWVQNYDRLSDAAAPDSTRERKRKKMKHLCGGGYKAFARKFEPVMEAMNSEKSVPPLLTENVILRTNESFQPHSSHTDKDLSLKQTSPSKIIYNKRRRNNDRDASSSASKFSSVMPAVNPFNRSSTYTRRMISAKHNSSNISTSNSSSRASASTTSSSSSQRRHGSSSQNGGDRERLIQRQRQLQQIIAHAAKYAGMDRSGLQEVAKKTPGLKSQIPLIVQQSSDIRDRVRAIAKLLTAAAKKVGVKLNPRQKK
jgi:hypothetical protein